MLFNFCLDSLRSCKNEGFRCKIERAFCICFGSAILFSYEFLDDADRRALLFRWVVRSVFRVLVVFGDYTFSVWYSSTVLRGGLSDVRSCSMLTLPERTSDK